MMSALRSAIERIRRIDLPKLYKEHTKLERKSNKILVDDYITRSNIFRDIYNPENHNRPFVFSAAKLINIDVDIDDLLMENGLPFLRSEFAFLVSPSLFSAYLKWCYLMDSINEVAIKYPLIYEPIIRLHERGSYLYKRHGEIFCESNIWLNNCYNYRSSVLLEDLSDEFLDEFDL